MQETAQKKLSYLLWLALFFVILLDKRDAIRVFTQVPQKVSLSKLNSRGLIKEIYPNIKEAIDRFPSDENEYFISAPPHVDGSNHQRLIEMAFPRKYSPAARCGFDVNPKKFYPPKSLEFEEMAYNVVCRS